MSLFNGDKSRANRERKQNIQRRIRTRALVLAETAKAKSTGPAKREKAAIHSATVAK